MVQKEQLRKWWKANYPREEVIRRRRALRIIETIRQSEIFLQSKTVALYSALPWEVEVKPLWVERPGNCVFPKVDLMRTGIHFYRIGNWSDMQEGYAQIFEPEVPEGYRVQQWEAPSLILVPGFAFDQTGARVGSGKGFYDRFLAKIGKGIVKWGVCHQEQIQKEKLAQEQTDVRMDALITEEGYFPVEF